MAITGNVTTAAGVAADLVRIFRWPDNKLETTAVPDAVGDWSAIVGASGDYGITYIADGCQPITHGPYYVEGDDIHWDKVVALLHFDGPDGSTNIVDETGRQWTAIGNSALSSSEFALGTASAEFDGSSTGGMYSPNTPDLNLMKEDFTIECFVYPRSTSGHRDIVSLYGYAYNRRSWSFHIYNGTLQLRTSTNGGSATDIVNTSAPMNRWAHVAVTREGDKFRLFVDGILKDEAQSSMTFYNNTSDPINIGRVFPTPNDFYDGFIDELRITVGVARYTEDFTPPTEPFPNSGAS